MLGNMECDLMQDNASMGYRSRSDSNSAATDFLDSFFVGYDKRVRPYYKGPSVNVSVNMFINSFWQIAETSMDYRVNIFLRSRWNDPRLAFTGYDEDVIAVHPSMLDCIWTPDIFFANEKQASFHEVTTENKLLRVFKNGDIRSSVRLSLTLACGMDLLTFPMDIQTCSMELESFGYDMRDLAFQWQDKDAVELPRQLSLPQFQILGHKLDSCTKVYETGSFTCIKVTFILKRQMGYYLIQTYIPSTLIVILSWVSFWISIDAAPARTALGITTVLTMTTQSSGARSSLPKVSYIKGIDVWMAVCLVFVFAALVEFAAVNFLSRQQKQLLKRHLLWLGRQKSTISRHLTGKKQKENFDNYSHTRPVFQDREQDSFYCWKVVLPPNSVEEDNIGQAEKYKKKAQAVDNISRVIFPIGFIGFNIVYWVAYLGIKDEDSYTKDALLYDL